MQVENSAYITDINSYLNSLQNVINKVDRNEINLFLQILLNAYHAEKQIFVMGNGGSAATASHFACDLNKGISFGKDKRFKIICLNDNIPTMLAYSNDTSYDEVFVEQLKNFLQEGDVVIGFSGSGNSKNVLKAIEYANSKNALTVGITGYSGGKLKETAKCSVNSNVDDMQLSEDMHLVYVHIAMKILNLLLQ